ASSKKVDTKSGRKLSRRERLAEARREAERRRREEAAPRAEIARQAAIARALAIARQRAADQALRDETAANILRDDPTGEDLEVRRVAVEALGERAGSVVVMDPKNGRVYSIVNQEWALRRGNVPCSTIKLVTGLAGLADSVIDPVQTVNISDGSYRLDLTDSLAYSNNAYFQKVGGYVGFDRMMGYAREFGLGEKTGINHPNESAGRLPMFKSGYAVNHMSSHGDDVEVTTTQLANMASAIGNGGTLLVPHLPRTPQESVQFKTEVRRRLNVPKEHLQRLLPGMIGAVTYGTGRSANDPTQTIAGKTGTCSGQGSKVGLFTSFGPVHDARLAVAVITRGSGERGRTAATVAGKIYRGLNHRFGNRGGAPLLATDALAPRPKIDPSKAAAISDEDKESDAYVVSEATNEAGETNVRSTLSVPTRPTEVTTRPGIAAPAASPTQTPERPRRVLTNTP
ncbi:MAG: penicillin-binding transpeptidase domain-containing protein, partial [Acidobacteriota bacterium]|nr:penicillin-binding transpeptidase domain-containing protein [Acidobacteriota bacterium]